MFDKSIIGGRRIISSKDYSAGSAIIVDMANNMWAVVAIDSITESIIGSKMFCYTDNTETDVWKTCLKYYKHVKDCLMRRAPDEIIEDIA